MIRYISNSLDLVRMHMGLCRMTFLAFSSRTRQQEILYAFCNKNYFRIKYSIKIALSYNQGVNLFIFLF